MKKRGSMFIILLLVTPWILGCNENDSVQDKDMEVHFIDVSQGDSILIQSPNDETMLIDGGPSSAGDEVVSYLNSLNIDELDVVVATHPDADHIGGLLNVVENFKVETFVNSGKDHSTETYEELLSAVSSKKINYTEPTIGSTIALDKDIKVKIFFADSEAKDNNDASIVLKVTYNEVSFLLTGDADVNIEKQIASKYDVSAEILKAGHHGSDTSSGLSFLQEVQPDLAILSYGKDNAYGHPHETALEHLKSVGSKIYSTAENGTIIVTTNGDTYSVKVKQFSGDGLTTTPSLSQPKPDHKVNSEPYIIQSSPNTFLNCSEMREYYPSGVQSTHPSYAAKHDRDKDGWACEK